MTGRRGMPVVWQAYEGVDRSRSCPDCGAAPEAWCTRPDGRVRRVPCVRRPRSAVPVIDTDVNDASTVSPSPSVNPEVAQAGSNGFRGGGWAAVDFSQPRHEQEID